MSNAAVRASILLPVKNAGDLFDHVIRALEQQRDVTFEIIIVDSGSKDQTIAKVKDLQKRAPFAVKLLHIKPEEYGHGRTRNFLAEHARGEILVLLTHDASPMTPTWLKSIIAPFDSPQFGSKVGLVFGPHRSRPDGNPIIRAELNSFFDGFAELDDDGKPRTTVYAGDPATGVDRTGPPDDDVLRFSSDVNAAVRKTAWQECKFRDVTYCEDQLIARDLLERGWYKVYEPSAAVYHSHNFSIFEFFRRYVDEWQGMFNAFGHVNVQHIWHLPSRIIRASWATRHALVSDPRLSLFQKVLWYPRAAVLATVRQLAGYIGPRLTKLPVWIRKRISREYHLLNA